MPVCKVKKHVLIWVVVKIKKYLAIALAGFLGGCNDCCHTEHQPEVTYKRANASAATLEEISVTQMLEISYSKKDRKDRFPTKTARLTAQEYCKLDKLIHKADVFSMRNEYHPEQHLLGMSTVTLDIKENEKHKAITIEGSAQYPKELDSVMEYLTQLKDEKLVWDAKRRKE